MKTLRPWPKSLLFSLLLSTLIQCTTTHAAAATEQKQPQKAESDEKFITEFPRSTILITANMNGNGSEAKMSLFSLRLCLARKLAEEKEMLLKRMGKPRNRWGVFGNGNGNGNGIKFHVRYRTLMAIDGFRRNGERLRGWWEGRGRGLGG